MTDNLAWSQLKKIDVEKEKMVKQKGKYSYISWAMAWSALCDIYPDSTFEKHCNEQGFPYFKDEQGYCFTKVTVTVKGKSVTEMLPVLNNYNKPIKNPDSMDVNTSLQRCLAKAVALHGLGVHVYSGEDIAEIPDNLGEEDAKPKEIQKPEVKKVEEDVKKVEEKASKPDTLKIDVPEKNSFTKVDTNVDIKKVGEYGEKIIEVYEKVALPAIKTVDDLNSYYEREKATLENLKQNAVDVYDKIIDLFKQRKEKING
jgi:hypothetical protein|tara:strand:- start:97 stop:867 length:771 start_codon:yes stop_codon:yes gene_type:complete